MSNSLDNLEQRLQALDRASRLRIPGSHGADSSIGSLLSPRGDALRLRRGAAGGDLGLGLGLGGRSG